MRTFRFAVFLILGLGCVSPEPKPDPTPQPRPLATGPQLYQCLCHVRCWSGGTPPTSRPKHGGTWCARSVEEARERASGSSACRSNPNNCSTERVACSLFSESC
jgi:hypothetical protein